MFTGGLHWIWNNVFWNTIHYIASKQYLFSKSNNTVTLHMRCLNGNASRVWTHIARNKDMFNTKKRRNSPLLQQYLYLGRSRESTARVCDSLLDKPHVRSSRGLQSGSSPHVDGLKLMWTRCSPFINQWLVAQLNLSRENDVRAF